MANQGGGFWRSLIIGRILGGIAPRESVKFGKESEVQIPRWQTWELILNVDILIAVAIFLICWGMEWAASGDMYYLLHHIAPWGRITRCWLLFATWPGLFIAYSISARRHAKELLNRHWEEWAAIERSMKYLNQDTQDALNVTPAIQVELTELDDDIFASLFEEEG